MKWTCTACGSASTAKAVSLLVQLGWWFTEAEGSLCPSCARKTSYARGLETLKHARELRLAAK